MNKEQLNFFNQCTKNLDPADKKYIRGAVEHLLRKGVPFEKLKCFFDGTPAYKQGQKN